MRKAAPAPPKPATPLPEPKFNPYFVIAAVMALFVPILVLPAVLDNVFNTPKTLLMQLGASLMAVVYSIQLFGRKEVSITRSAVPKLMMGITEGLYLRHFGLVEKVRLPLPGTRYALLSVVLLFLIGWVTYSGYRPLKGERAHLEYKKAMTMGKFKEAERHIVKAIEVDPDNTLYSLHGAQLYMGPAKDLAKARDLLEQAVHHFNGDVTKWSLYYLKGQLAFQTGAIMESKAAFEKSLQYNPLYKEAKEKLDEVNKLLKEHDRVMIKFK